MKSYLHGLTAVHDGEPVYRGLYANAGVTDKPAYPRAEHPVIRTHPVTGKKALYVNRGFTHHIVGIPATRAMPCLPTSISTRKIRYSNVVFDGPRMRSHSGTIVARSTGRCGTTGRTPDRAIG